MHSLYSQTSFNLSHKKSSKPAGPQILHIWSGQEGNLEIIKSAPVQIGKLRPGKAEDAEWVSKRTKTRTPPPGGAPQRLPTRRHCVCHWFLPLAAFGPAVAPRSLEKRASPSWAWLGVSCFSTNLTGPLAPFAATGAFLNGWHWALLPLALCSSFPGRRGPSAFYLIRAEEASPVLGRGGC